MQQQTTLEMQQQTALTNKLLTRASQAGDDEKNGSGQDYDPLDSAEQLQAEKDKIDDATNDDAKESVSAVEEVAPSSEEVDEAELVNSAQFAEELQSAIDHVQRIAKTHRAEMIHAAKQQFERETGSAPTQRMVDDAMETMKESLVTAEPEISSTEPATTDIDANSKPAEAELDGVSAEDMESALEHVRTLGRLHRTEFESRIRAQYADINGAEPSSDELSGIFARIRESLAEEARDEFLDIHDQEELDGDSDYEPSADQLTFQFFKDNADDVAAESEDIDGELDDLRDDSLLSESDESEVGSRSTELSEHELQFSDTASTFDEAHFSGEMDFALKHVRDLASLQQSEFVNSICDTFAELNGCEPSLEELNGVFADITEAFANEPEGNGGISWDISIDDFVNTDADYRPADDVFDYAQDEVDQQLFDDVDEVMHELDDELLGADMDFALEHVRNLANVHQSELVNKVCDMFAEEYGREASVAHLRDLFQEIKQDLAFEAVDQDFDDAEASEAGSVSVDEEGVFDEEAFGEDMDFALDHIRGLAVSHQSEFVGRICDLFAEEYDAEPSAWELSELFRGIQLRFAKEADQTGSAFIVSVGESASESAEEIEEEESDDLSEQDSYDAEQDSFDYAVDAEDDIDSEFQVDAESEIESESVEESEAQSEDASERDSYSPSNDSMDYGVDAQDSVDFASSASESDRESESVSESELSIDVSELEQDIESALNEETQESDAEQQSEMQSALDHISELGRAHQKQFVDALCDSFVELNGQEPSVSELYEIFGGIKQGFAEEADEEDADESSSDDEEAELSESKATFSEADSEASATDVEFDEEQFADEMDSALDNVRDLAASHRKDFVNTLCDIISAQNDQEPTTDDLFAAFDGIKQSFADEAEESESVDESESESEQESDQSDSYDPEEDSFDYAIDAEDDIDSEFQVDAESEVESTFESALDDVDEDLSEQGSYAPTQDSFDYALDEQDDIVSESAESEAELEESAESEVSLESAETFAEEMASALANIERLGRAQSEPLIHAICDIHSKFTGEEATLSQLVSIFGDIRQSFAEEAHEDSSAEESESEEGSYAESTDVAVGTEYSTEEEEEQSEEESDEDFSEEDSYDPSEDSFDYAVDESSSTAVSVSELESASVEESEYGAESYNPSDDSFDYAVDVADSIDFVSESGTEIESEASL